MIRRSQLFRVALAMVTMVIMGTDSPRVFAQSHRPSVQGRMVTLGRLIRSGQSSNGAPRFALLDDEGTLTSYVIPSTGMSLGAYVNQHVAVTARRSRESNNGIRYLLAEHIKPMGAALDLRAPEVTPTVASEVATQRAPLSVGATLRNGMDFDQVTGTEPLQPIPAARYDEPLSWDDGSNDRSAVQRASHEHELPEPIAVDPGYSDPYSNEYGMAGESSSYDATVDSRIGHGQSCSSCGADVVGGGCSDCGSGGVCGSACCPCGPSGRFWIRGEYLLWWTKGMDLPPLVTTTSGTPLAQDAGVLGTDGTEVLFGDNEIFDDTRSGYRFRIGTWLDYCQWTGVELDYFRLQDESDRFSRTSVGNPILARPFFNANLNEEDAELVALSGVVSGTVTVRASTEMSGFAPRFRRNLLCENFVSNSGCACGTCSGCGDFGCQPSGGQRVDFTLGYRYLNLDERLRITEQLATSSNGALTNFNLRDSFDTENTFHGAEVGVVWEYYRGPWSMEFFSRAGLGNNRRRVRIAGSTESAVQGTVFSDVGGLLALPSNIGTYRDDEFVVIPELGVNLGYQIAPSMRFLVGYTFLYWRDVVRPGDQIDRRVNTDLLPPAINTNGSQVPAFAFNDTSFWAQGLNLGLDWRW